MQWLEVVLEITTFSSFFQSFGGKFGCKWVIKFLRSLNEGHLRFLEFSKKLKLLKKLMRAHTTLILNGNSIRAIFFRGRNRYNVETFLRCTGFCLYFLHFIYVKPVRSPLIQRTPVYRIIVPVACLNVL